MVSLLWVILPRRRTFSHLLEDNCSSYYSADAQLSSNPEQVILYGTSIHSCGVISAGHLVDICLFVFSLLIVYRGH